MFVNSYLMVAAFFSIISGAFYYFDLTAIAGLVVGVFLGMLLSEGIMD